MTSKLTLAAQFEKIDNLLSQTRQYWQILPFEHLVLPWLSNQPLCDFLHQLNEEAIEQLDSGDDVMLRRAIEPFVESSLDIIAPLSCDVVASLDVPSWFKAGVKGRKWNQLEQFAAHIPQSKHTILEWCAGKGHLGRVLAYTQHRPVVSVEWQENLCNQGTTLANHYELNQKFIHADVFDATARTLLHSEQHVVALHACGDLHTELLKQACAAQTATISLAPCCYHLIGTPYYQALSKQGMCSDLRLNKRDLGLSMAQTVVATQRERKHRATEVAWRLAFDLLQRSLRQTDEYLPLPSIKQSMLTGDFSDFCHWACEKKSLNLPQGIDLKEFERKGWQRKALNGKIEIVTHAFRQLLERWLLLDRMLFLEEQGYRVSLQEFCKKSTTPRNALIIAQR